MTEPFHALGREANNALAAAFEDQLIAVSERLGWTVMCRNIDAFVQHQGQSQSRGFDALLAIHDPQENRREGYVLEAKRHEHPAYAAIGKEAQELHDKIARLNATESFWKNSVIRTALDAPLRFGILSHRTFGFSPDQAQERLRSVTLRNRKHGLGAPVIKFMGPDVLEAVAHVIRSCRPTEWLWPPMRRRDAEWATACPPWALLVGGMVAFRDAQGHEGVLLHDTLAHGDAELLADVFDDWGVNPESVICTRLRSETWRVVKDDWMGTVERRAGRVTGRLPAQVEPKMLSDRLTTFDELWPAAA